MPSSQKQKKSGKRRYTPVVGIAIISLLICGLFFPLLMTGVGQVLFPYQAKGDIVQLNGMPCETGNYCVGSYLINNNFTLPIFFHARPANESASTVDPDITMQDAYSQIPGISNATDISSADLYNIVNNNTEGKYWIFGSPYVNVLNLNLVLIKDYPSVYKNFTIINA
jgi:K+-transporting ATPase ATPase C chain